MATRYQKFIGGLLGEDVEGMSEEERKQLSRQGTTSAILGLLGGQGLMGGLSAYGEQRAAKKQKKAAEEEMGRITGRLFGGAPAAPADMGADETGLGPVAIQSQYRKSPQEALQRLYGTSAGRDVAQIAPGLLKTAEEMAAPDDYVYQSVSGVGLVAVNKKDPSDVRVVQSERARATGPSERFKILSPAEAKANNLPAGIVYQQNLVTKQITPMQTGGAGGLSDTDVRQYRTAKIGIQNARGQMQNLQSVLDEVPPYKAIAGEGRGKLEASYSLALSAIRQLQNSGVLNVGELPFLEKALADPTSFSAIATSPIQRGKLKGQIDTVMKLLDQQEQTLKTQYGMDGAPGSEPTAPSSGVSAPSMAGGRRGRKPSAEALKRAEGYY